MAEWMKTPRKVSSVGSDRNALQVAQVRPAPGSPDSIEQGIGTLELTSNGNGRMDENTSQGIKRGFAGKTGDLDILKPVVVETGMPGFQAFACEDISVGLVLLA